MSGGTGNDIYIVDTATDVVTENAGQGNDTVKTGLSSYTLGANVENLIYTGAGTFTGTGNTLANAISGGNANDTIAGGGGNDLLIGNGGNDSINGNGWRRRDLRRSGQRHADRRSRRRHAQRRRGQ